MVTVVGLVVLTRVRVRWKGSRAVVLLLVIEHFEEMGFRRLRVRRRGECWEWWAAVVGSWVGRAEVRYLW